MLKNDRWIIENGREGMIKPFIMKNIKEIDGEKIFSYGTQPYGYDIRLEERFLLPEISPLSHNIVDIHDVGNMFEEIESDELIIMPNSYIVGFSLESLNIPKNVTVLIYSKSSLTTKGIFVNATPIDAGFVGKLRLSIVNFNSFAVRLHPNEGIAQLLFLESDEYPLKDYQKKGGNY